MAAVEVDRLRLRCDVARREPARFALEDALRTELPDDDRLVLLRRLEVAPAGSSAHPAWRQAAMRDAWKAATGGARHGGADGADAANCVWFASEAEAERLLLARLLRGLAADGWFWKLALPRWRGRAARDWLSELVLEAAVLGEERRLLALAEACVAAGAEQVLVEALERAAPRMPPAPDRARSVPRESDTSPADPKAESLAALKGQAAARAVASFSPPVQAALRRLASLVPAAPALRAILKAQILHRSPALALAPAVLARAIDEASFLLVSPSRAPGAIPRIATQAELRRANRDPAAERDPAPPDTPAHDAGSAPSGQPERSKQRRPVAEARVRATEPPMAEAPLRLPRHSRHAGLWLVVPALGDMGLRGWLARHPDLLGDHPGAQLVLTIARHHRVALDDPALAVLGEVDREAAPPEWACLWRHGLDRWLRRCARRRLHDLVMRPGQLDWDDRRFELTFPLADADIRLRRRALDRDPGWTDWLGLSIRYHFRAANER
jgi:hypothetical protein